jgi:starvation-inducible DNA-binding protein
MSHTAQNQAEHRSTELEPQAAGRVNDPLRALLSETVELELCTRICHWQVTGSQFRSLHALFDEQAGELAEMADAVAERAQALGSSRIVTAADLVSTSRLTLPPESEAMLMSLALANRRLTRSIRQVRRAAEASDDLVTVSISDGWMAEGERRIWMLEASRAGVAS